MPGTHGTHGMHPVHGMHGVPSLLSVNVGMPQNVDWQGKTVFTGVWKAPVEGPVMVRRLNIDGDGQGDLAGHGGEQRAVLVYQIQSYRHWQRYFGRDDFAYGQFGENLTVDGLSDDEVCIGDRYVIGDAEFEVTQPRVTCYRVGLRMGEPRLPALLVGHHRPGFYMRVVREGHIRAGDTITRSRTGPGSLSVSATDALLYLPDRDPEKLRTALSIRALSPGWQGSFRELLADATAGTANGDAGPGTGPGAAHGPAWPGFRKLRVERAVAENPTVTSFYLDTPDGTPLPAPKAGQYLALRLPVSGSPESPPQIRSYSLSSTPVDGRYRITVKHEPHGRASGYLSGTVHRGDLLEVAAPRGEFVLSQDDGPVLLVSAGIGLTPVLAMLHELTANDPDREVWWIHGARGPQEHPLATEAHELLAALPHGHEHIFYSSPAPAPTSAPTRDRGHDGSFTPGRLTAAALTALALPTAHASAYVCGPTAFMSDMQRALTAAGVDPARVHTETFAALAASTPGITAQATTPPHRPAGTPGTGPQVSFARSGISTPFPQEAGSLLELADACDVPARWSCRTGVCHTCTTPLLSGKVTYDPAPLEDPPDGEVLICCSRPDGDVVLDM